MMLIIKKHTQLLWRRAGEQEIKNVEVSLSVQGSDNTGLLEKVVCDLATNWVALEVKLNLHVLSKTTAVVIPQGLGISKG
jgi:hypothetical protein